MHAINNLSKVPKLVVLTKDLMIKQLDGSHTEALCTLIDQNRSYLTKWLPWLSSCISQSDVLNFITGANDTPYKDSKLPFVVFYKEEIAGIINFNRMDLSSGKAEMGVWIGEAFQGLGLVTCAGSKLIEIGFKQLDLQEISVRCAVNNINSQSIPIRLGFKKTDTVKENIYGVYMDVIVYTMQRDQWHRLSLSKNL